MQNTSQKNKEKVILSTTDLLAVGRNKLANERTMLAYIRTFLSFVVAGVSLIQFFDVRIFILLGYGLLPTGFLILIVGIVRCHRIQKQLNKLEINGQ